MRRVIAIVIALLLAGAGTFFLVTYVRGAESRALEGEVVVGVLVAEQPIAAGTPAEDLATRVQLEQVPAKVAAAGAVDDLADLAGQVAAIALLPGEQLVAGRFLSPEDYQATLGAGPRVEVPEDLLQVTVSLNPERVVGGQLQPGDVVAVFASFDPFALDTVEPTGLDPDEIPVLVPDEGTEEDARTGRQTPNSTRIILLGVLVTNLQAEELPRTVDEEEAAAGAPDLAPTGNLLVTLALRPADAERLVFTAEHGSIWLAVEGSEVSDSPTPGQTRVSIYEAR
ncbi:MAG: cpaB [Actinobacteria bacterium]|nr:cpaB [Actinomycetota bacterium]